MLDLHVAFGNIKWKSDFVPILFYVVYMKAQLTFGFRNSSYITNIKI